MWPLRNEHRPATKSSKQITMHGQTVRPARQCRVIRSYYPQYMFPICSPYTPEPSTTRKGLKLSPRPPPSTFTSHNKRKCTVQFPNNHLQQRLPKEYRGRILKKTLTSVHVRRMQHVRKWNLPLIQIHRRQLQHIGSFSGLD